MPSLTFKAVYGWGWFRGPSSERVEVPEPFRVAAHRVSETEIVGLVEPPHLFSGMHVRLSLRNTAGGESSWNVFLEKSGQEQITGFAESA